MNIARLFSFTRLLEDELRRERVLRRRDQLKADRERQRLVDALARASNKQAVFDRPTSDSQPPVSMPVFGPTAIAMEEARKEREEQEKILRRAAEARDNGHVQIPQIPNS